MHQHVRIRIIGTIAAACVGGSVISACGALPGKKFTDDATVSKKITSVRLDGDSGGVTVHGGKSGRPVALHRSVTYRGDRPAAATYRVEDGGVLVLGGCGDGCSVDYSVELPAGLPVSGETSNGAVILSKVGTVDVATSSGSIELTDIAGAVDARTSNGRITGRGLSGTHIDAESSNGEIDLTAATAQSIRAKTSNGSVTVTVPKGPYRVSAGTSSGSKHLGVADDPSARYRLDLNTSNGDVTARPA